MAAWEHGGGFSVDAKVRIEAHERDGLERLPRYCARPAFALERLREIDPEHLVYESVKPGPRGSVSLMPTPMQLLDRLAALIPPPRRHRHRYCGVPAPNWSLPTAVTALAQPQPAPADSSSSSAIAPPEAITEEPAHRKAARYAWALLPARIYEVLPLLCPKCGGEMRIIAFVTEAVAIRKILGPSGRADIATGCQAGPRSAAFGNAAGRARRDRPPCPSLNRPMGSNSVSRGRARARRAALARPGPLVPVAPSPANCGRPGGHRQ